MTLTNFRRQTEPIWVTNYSYSVSDTSLGGAVVVRNSRQSKTGQLRDGHSNGIVWARARDCSGWVAARRAEVPVCIRRQVQFWL